MLFGEVALLFRTKRTASVRVKDRCTVGALDAENVVELLRNFPQVENWMREETTRYNDNWKKYQINILTRVDYFEPLPYAIREELHYKLVLENYEKGTKLFNRGHECSCLFFLI
jgi:hypothetical protein